MAFEYCPCEHDEEEEEDYIEMEITAYPNDFLFNSRRDFEFLIPSSSSMDRELFAISPADELFYKGKLLPLHLSPSLEMIEDLLHVSATSEEEDCEQLHGLGEISHETPLATSIVAAATPPETCSTVSPFESCQVRRELEGDQYSLEYQKSKGEKGLHANGVPPPKKISWKRTLKLIKQSSFASQLKASGAFLKSLFTSRLLWESSEPEGKRKQSKSMQTRNNKDDCIIDTPTPATDHQRSGKDYAAKGGGEFRRRRLIFGTHKLSSSSSSTSWGSSSSSSTDLHRLGTSSGAKLDIECSIQGAIAHCKQSHPAGEPIIRHTN